MVQKIHVHITFIFCNSRLCVRRLGVDFTFPLSHDQQEEQQQPSPEESVKEFWNLAHTH